MEYLSLAEISVSKDQGRRFSSTRLLPGQRLSHEELVLRLKISQTPIREALLTTGSGGICHSAHQSRGYRVSEMTAEEVEELFGLRERVGSLLHRRGDPAHYAGRDQARWSKA